MGACKSRGQPKVANSYAVTRDPQCTVGEGEGLHVGEKQEWRAFLGESTSPFLAGASAEEGVFSQA